MTGFAPCDVMQTGDAGRRERVLWIDRDRGRAVLIDIDAERALPVLRPLDVLEAQVEAGEIARIDDPWLRPVLEDATPPTHRTRRDAAWRLIEPLIRAQPDTFLEGPRGALVAQTVARGEASRTRLYRLLRRYWQRGMTPNALLPDYANSGGRGKDKAASGRKRGGRPVYGPEGINVTPDIREAFTLSVQRHLVKSKNMTVSECYNRCLGDFFCDVRVDPETGRQRRVLRDQHPSLHQFRYWLAKDDNPLALKRKRRTARVYDKDSRGLLGSSRAEVAAPADRFQIDATVADIYLVSQFDRRRIVGRPTIYVIVDVFSGLIAGLYVGFEHASWLGAMMALINAAMDKTAYCARYGVEITEADWPCATLPRTLLADRGEMLGPKADALVNNFGIHLENTAPYRADWKGIVEQQFRLLPAAFRDYTPGYIEPDFRERGARDYRQDATFTLDEFTAIIIRCVLFYNNEREITGYRRDAGMIAEDMPPVPIELWEWGLSARGGAQRRYPEDRVRLSLLPTATASVTHRGIEFHGCLYSCPTAIAERWFDKARQRGRWKVDISYDPRLLDEIHLHDARGSFGFLPCALTDLSAAQRGKTLWEIDEQRRQDRRRIAQSDGSRREARINLGQHLREIADAALTKTAAAGPSAESAAARVRGIRANCAAERDAERRAAVETARPRGDGAKVTPIRPEITTDRDFSLPSVARFRKRHSDDETEGGDD
ncbi:Mu transposase C-terminal domain-containing protein [Rubrimonas cliftonensis]|uniref:Mu transposase, C-terminal n=1 Tax=Rubrimonas cliftonensis TaxID=89524 RepID=A0A1H4CTA1_9RHOB|nr:Mu transposase C-terminal domain-containing protein [Rubrimonas cliftonensis]SEA63548.1 Mu transposase, C-terminal [Rubrimonas cliftonensis]